MGIAIGGCSSLEDRRSKANMIQEALQALEHGIDLLGELVAEIHAGNVPTQRAEKAPAEPPMALETLLDVAPSRIKASRDRIQKHLDELRAALL